MVATPTHGKNLKNLLFQSQKADDFETWCEALCERWLVVLGLTAL